MERVPLRVMHGLASENGVPRRLECGKSDTVRRRRPIGEMPQFSAIRRGERMHLGAVGAYGRAWAPPDIAQSMGQTGRRCGVATVWPEPCVGVLSTVIEDEGDVHADDTRRRPARRRA